MIIIEQLKEKKPGRNYVFTAIEQLTDPEQIKAFMDEYCQEVPPDIANSNVGYILGYYSPETIKLWFDTLSDVSHPIFGRALAHIDPESAFAAGLEFGRKLKEGR